MAIRNIDCTLSLIKTTEAAILADDTIRNGSLYLTTDTRNLYVDLEGQRHCFSSIYFKDNFDDLVALPKVEQALYWNISNNKGYRYINGVLTEVFTSDSVNAATLETVDSLSDIQTPQSNKIYLLPLEESEGIGGNTYAVYVYEGDEFQRVTPKVSEVTNIANAQVEAAFADLTTELAAVRDALKADTLDDPSEYYDNISAFYNDVYPKAQTYSRDELNTLFSELTEDLTNKTNTVQGPVAKINDSVEVNDIFTINLVDDVAFYKHNVAESASLTFDTSRLTNEGVITFEVLLNNAKSANMHFNGNIAWVDGVEPTYYNNTIVGFRSFDNGLNWIAYYQGGWN